jgi:hypothetical protein
MQPRGFDTGQCGKTTETRTRNANMTSICEYIDGNPGWASISGRSSSLDAGHLGSAHCGEVFYFDLRSGITTIRPLS